MPEKNTQNNRLNLPALPSIGSMMNMKGTQNNGYNLLEKNNKPNSTASSPPPEISQTEGINEIIAFNADKKKAYNEQLASMKVLLQDVLQKLIEISAQNTHNYDSLKKNIETSNALDEIKPKLDKTQQLIVSGIKSVLKELPPKPLPAQISSLPPPFWQVHLTVPNILLGANLIIVSSLFIYLVFIK